VLDYGGKDLLFSYKVIQNSLARAVVKAPKFYHVTPILKFLFSIPILSNGEF